MVDNIETYFKGGIFLLSAGLIPFSNAFRECMMKCLVGEFEDTSEIKSPENKNKSDNKGSSLGQKHIRCSKERQPQ